MIIKLKDYSNEEILNIMSKRISGFLDQYPYARGNFKQLANTTINHYKKINLRFNTNNGISSTTEAIGWLTNYNKLDYKDYSISDFIEFEFIGSIFNGIQRIINGYELTEC